MYFGRVSKPGNMNDRIGLPSVLIWVNELVYDYKYLLWHGVGLEILALYQSPCILNETPLQGGKVNLSER